MALRTYAVTHPGRVRTLNEDTWSADPERGIFLVADGMGGAEAGEVASAIARDSIVSSIRAGDSLDASLQAAHVSVLAASRDGRGALGMGTTAVAVRFAGDRFEGAWVGDSRCYLWSSRRRTLTRLSRDHSQVEALVSQGLITPEQAHRHPQKNLITQALGQSSLAAVQPGRCEGRLAAGDSLLLCSDGLSDELTDPQIAAVLVGRPSLPEAIEALREAALAAGGHDNITVVGIQRSGWSDFARDVPAGVAYGLMGAALGMLGLLWLKFRV